MRAFLAAAAAAVANGDVNEGWSCGGPLTMVHGAKIGDLVDGGFAVTHEGAPLAPREAHGVFLGHTMAVEVSAPAGKALKGWLIAPSKGKVPGDRRRSRREARSGLIRDALDSGRRRRRSRGDASSNARDVEIGSQVRPGDDRSVETGCRPRGVTHVVRDDHAAHPSKISVNFDLPHKRGAA